MSQNPQNFSLTRPLRIFQRFRLVKFIEKFKTRVKNLKIEKIIAFNKYLLELLFGSCRFDSLFYKMRLFLKFLKVTKRWIVVKLF